MQIWKMSADDYAKIKASERHHFIHLNSTSHTADKAHYHMALSRSVVTMLEQELGVQLSEVATIMPDGLPSKLTHPHDAVMISDAELRATALCAPGHHRDGTPEIVYHIAAALTDKTKTS
jgi:hypothetical protein